MEFVGQWLFDAGEALLKAALNPFSCLGWVLVALLFRYRTELERKLFSVRLHGVPGEWLGAAGAGLLVALAVSVVAAVLGVRLTVDAVFWTWGVLLVLLVFRIRLANLLYAAAVVGLLQGAVHLLADEVPDGWTWLAASLASIHLPSLWLLAALVLAGQAVLVRVTASRGAMPLHVMGKRGKPIGAYQLQGLWLMPLLLVAPVAGDSLPWWQAWLLVPSDGGAGPATAAGLAAGLAEGLPWPVLFGGGAADGLLAAWTNGWASGWSGWGGGWIRDWTGGWVGSGGFAASAGVLDGGLSGEEGDLVSVVQGGRFGGWALLVFPALAGFVDMTGSVLPEIRARRLALRHAVWSVTAAVAAVTAVLLPAALPVVAVLVLALPETWSLLAARAARRQSPQFVHGGRGLRVLDVLRDSPAAEMGILRGETLVKANGLPVNTPAQLHAGLRANPAFSRLEVIDADGHNRFVQRALYSGDHHQLGLMLCPDDRTPAVVRWRALTLARMLAIPVLKRYVPADNPWGRIHADQKDAADRADAAGKADAADRADASVRSDAGGTGEADSAGAGAVPGSKTGTAKDPHMRETAAAKEEKK